MSDSTSWHQYPKVYELGHAALLELLLDDVIVEEKVDGSQFSFGIFAGELKIRSKGVEMHPDFPEGMFQEAAEYVKSIKGQMRDGWTYRAEYLRSPKHNTLAYDRIPRNHLIVFDINIGHEAYAPPDVKQYEAARIGLEVVPVMKLGKLENVLMFRELLETVSCLGGQKVEGLVVKNYHRFGPDKKVLMGKYVSEQFKETHSADWKTRHPGKGDIIEQLSTKFRTPARWAKAVQHLKEAGKLEGSPRDIPLLIREAKGDLLTECDQELKTDLYEWAKNQVASGTIRGLAEWYKARLLEQQFEAKP